MSDERPRDLNAEELAQLEQSTGAGAAPLRIPPGTTTAIELFNPAAGMTGETSPAMPTAGPNEQPGSRSGASPASANKPAGRRR